MAVDTENVSASIREWLQENVSGSRDIPNDYPLIESGILTSLQTVELVMFLEDRFGITVEDEELDEENFGSISAITNLVAGKTG